VPIIWTRRERSLETASQAVALFYDLEGGR